MLKNIFRQFSVILLFFIANVSYGRADISAFDISNPAVNLIELRSGGVEKDGITAIDSPKFDQIQAAYYFTEDNLVIGVEVNGEARAYPVSILNWHEIVNDQILGTPIAVTWCPLTASAVVFNRMIKKELLDFGVSGMLYNSNLVMYDRQHKGLWSQLGAKALTGEFASRELEIIPSSVMTFGEWKKKHPESLVLSHNTGFSRNYIQDPYDDYHRSADIMFPLKEEDNRLLSKNKVVGIKIKKEAKAYPMEMIRNLDGPVTDKVGGRKIIIYPLATDAYITEKNGKPVPSVKAYWFAWSGFHPDTDVYDL